MTFTFTYPGILYLLWGVPLWALALHHLRQRRQAQRSQFTGNTLAGKLLPAAWPRLEWSQIALCLIGVTLLIGAAAGPRSRQRREQEVAMRGRDLVLLVDVSRSMLANDVHPSRLVRAKADMLDILDELRPGDRVALVAFRHRATRITPFTTDQRFLRQAISNLSIHSAPAGETDIGAAIRMALTVFDDESPAHKAVIMIADGEDLTGEAIRAAQAASQRRIPFFTVGLGSRTGSTIPDPGNPRNVLRHEGEPVITRLEEESLVTLARLTGGAYIPMETAGVGAFTLGQRIREHLRSVEMQAYATVETTDNMELFAYFLLPAILLLMLAGSMSQGQFLLRTRKGAAIMLLLATCATTDALADEPAGARSQSHRALARQAQAQQRDGALAEAANLYIQAASQQDVPTRLRDRYRYNAAIAALQAGDHVLADSLLDALPPIHQADAARAMSHFERGRQAPDGSAEGYGERLNQWQEAARLVQRFWQQAGEQDAAQDLETLDSILPLAQQDATNAEIIERFAETAPAELAWQMLRDQRTQQQTDQDALPPVGPERLRYFEEQARQRKDLAERYLALSHNLHAAGMPPEQVQALLQEQSGIQQQMETLRDLHTPAAARPAEIGHPLYQTWKNVAGHDSLLAESLRQQQWLQAALNDATGTPPPPVPLSELQTEAATLTDLFAERFQPPPETDPEIMEQVNQLSEDAARLQRLAAEMLNLNDEPGAKALQNEAVETLQRLVQILPQPPPQQQESDEQAEADPSEQPTGEPDGSTQPEQEETPAPPDTPEDEQADETPEPEDDSEEPGDGEMDEEDTVDIDAALEQVEQRAQEYQDRVQERQQRSQPRGTRDW